MLGREVNVAIVTSLFNSEITEQLLQGAHTTLLASGLLEDQIKIVKVPGAIEIPLVAKRLAQSKSYHAIICLGAVIRGETDHYEYVNQQVSQGCQQVMLAYDIPVIFGVLTTQNSLQARDRVGGKKGHKGVDAAQAAIHMIQLMQAL